MRFERQFVHFQLNRNRIITRETGFTESITGQTDRFHQAVNADVTQRIRADGLSDFLH